MKKRPVSIPSNCAAFMIQSFVMKDGPPGLAATDAAAGHFSLADAMRHGEAAGNAALEALGRTRRPGSTFAAARDPA